MIMVKKILLIVYLLLTSALFGCVNNKHYGNDYMEVFKTMKLDEAYYDFSSHYFKVYDDEEISANFDITELSAYFVYAEILSSEPGTNSKFVKVNKNKITVYRAVHRKESWGAYLVKIKDFKNYQLPKP